MLPVGRLTDGQVVKLAALERELGKIKLLGMLPAPEGALVVKAPTGREIVIPRERA